MIVEPLWVGDTVLSRFLSNR